MLAFVSFSKNNTYFLKHMKLKRKTCMRFFKMSLDFPFQVACLAANYLKGFFFYTSKRKVVCLFVAVVFFFFLMRLSLPQKASFKNQSLYFCQMETQKRPLILC